MEYETLSRVRVNISSFKITITTEPARRTTMYKLVVLGLAAAFVVKANPALQEGGTPPIIFGDADFDDLAAQGNSIGSYGELTYSNLCKIMFDDLQSIVLT